MGSHVLGVLSQQMCTIMAVASGIGPVELAMGLGYNENTYYATTVYILVPKPG